MDKLLTGLAILVGIYFIAQLVFFVAFLLLYFSMAAVGVASIHVAKSRGAALVPQRKFGTALAASVVWSGALTFGVMLGSVGLGNAMGVFNREEFTQGLVAAYPSYREAGANSLVFIFDWIIRDSYGFFFNIGCVIFMANRAFVAQSVGGSRWLAVLPPLAAMLLFFWAQHWESIWQLIGSGDAAQAHAIVDAAIEEALLPVTLTIQAFQAPAEVLDLGRSAYLNSHGNLFRLESFFPTIFCWIAIIIAGGNLLASSDPGTT